jgi:hypothetical protein
VSDRFTGRRRRPSAIPYARIASLVFALVAVGLLVTLPEPKYAAPSQPPLHAAPTWTSRESASTKGLLADGTTYTPKLFLEPGISLGVAPTPDGGSVRLILVRADQATELRRIATSAQPQFDGFAASGDTVVWAESLSSGNAGARTTLMRANWRAGGKPASVTTATAEPVFSGGEYDLVIHNNRVYWVAGAGSTPERTEIRSVPLNGGTVGTIHLTGGYALSAWPWAVTVNGARGQPAALFNYETNTKVELPTTDRESATCGPTWCRIGVFDNDALVQLDLVRPDGTGRRRIAGGEATPTIVDVMLLDRWVPLATDSGSSNTGLAVYDVTTGQATLVAIDASDVRAAGGLLWWSTGVAPDLTWHVLDVRTLG